MMLHQDELALGKARAQSQMQGALRPGGKGTDQRNRVY
jgi:hypothetical protein